MLAKKRIWNPAYVTFLLLVTSCSVTLAQAPGVSPIHQLRPGENQVSIFQNFTTILSHSSRIKSVLDFDAEVIKVDPVQGHTDRITVYGLATGVTTITIIDEFEQAVKVEVLVRGDVRHLESYLNRLYPHDDVHVEEIKGSVLLTGWVTRPEHINEIVSIASEFYPNVLNHMRIGGVQQVMLKATIMEVNRSKLRQLGMNFGLLKSDSYLLSTPGPITPIESLTVTGTGATPVFTGFSNASVSFGFMNPNRIFQGYVDALRTEGLLKIQATPMVVTHNGQPAELLNGGETPVLVPAGLGTTAIEFKPFGIILSAVPHILGNGRLRLQVEPQVVERDFANSVVVDGVTVPSFTVRKVSTQVEMNFGETLVIGGLISRREDSGTAKLPFFGELPWIGAAFGRKQYTEAETELIVLVTPEYVAPMSPSQIPTGGPGMFTDTPTDTELFFHNQMEIPRTGDECDAIFNCSECQKNGFCKLHPNGRMSLGNSAYGGYGAFGCGRAGGCGQAGCTDCGPVSGAQTPLIISPGAAQAGQAGPPVPETTPLPGPAMQNVPANPPVANPPVSNPPTANPPQGGPVNSGAAITPTGYSRTPVGSRPARPTSQSKPPRQTNATPRMSSGQVRQGLISPLLR